MDYGQEFYISLAVYGGIILAGLLVIIILGAFAWKLKGSLKKKQIIKELYEEKERKNGQHKGGARGKW